MACCRHAPAARVILLPISPKFVKQLQMSAMTGEDGKLYIFRVRDMKTYLAKALAVHPVKVTKDFGFWDGTAKRRSTAAGHRGQSPTKAWSSPGGERSSEAPRRRIQSGGARWGSRRAPSRK